MGSTNLGAACDDPQTFYYPPATEYKFIGNVYFPNTNKSLGTGDINAKCLQITISSIVTLSYVSLCSTRAMYDHVVRWANVTHVLKKEKNRVSPIIDFPWKEY